MAGSAGGILLAVAIIVLGGKLGGEAAVRLRQPAVVGELLVGILLGASMLGGLLGLPDLALVGQAHDVDEAGDPQAAGAFFLRHGADLGVADVLQALAAIGVILLLFEVGLESKISELRKVGVSSLLVALVGIVVSFVAGYAASWALTATWEPWRAADAALPDHLLHVFLGATLTATSVGITARVLADLGRLSSPEARIILGAAVLDDVGGLIILAIVAALVEAAGTGAGADALAIARITATALGFLAVSLLVGLKTVPRAYDALADRFQVAGFPIALAVAFALLMAYAASLAGLADIVGAFAAGLLLSGTRHAHDLFNGLRPIAALFVGFFFVTLGMQVDVGAILDNAAAVFLLGSLLAVLAIAAKLACGLAVVKDQANRMPVAVGMVPRGEVGLIFAGLGLAAGLLANWQYALLLYVVLVTTLVTPLWLGRLSSSFRADGDPATHAANLARATDPLQHH